MGIADMANTEGPQRLAAAPHRVNRGGCVLVLVLCFRRSLKFTRFSARQCRSKTSCLRRAFDLIMLITAGARLCAGTATC